MMLTLFVALPLMIHDELLPETALLFEVTFYQYQVDALIKEQARKGGDHSPDLPLREWLRNRFLNKLMTECPHTIKAGSVSNG